MEKIFRILQGKKAPHPPKRDYTDKHGDRRTKSSVSDSEDESSGVFISANESPSPRGCSPTPLPHGGGGVVGHGGNVERFRFGSQTSYGTGTVDLKSCGAGISAGGLVGTNSRLSSAGGGTMTAVESMDVRRRNDSGGGGAGGPTSPNVKQPIVLDDYSDPKDVIKAAVESGILTPGDEGPVTSQTIPYPENDYSVPYETSKQMILAKQGPLPEDGPISNHQYPTDDDYSLPYDIVKKTRHLILEEGWDPSRTSIPEDDYSLPYDVLKKMNKDPPQSKVTSKPSSVRQPQHQYEEPPDFRRDAAESSAAAAGGEDPVWADPGALLSNRGENDNAGQYNAPTSPQPDQTPKNDVRPQGEYDNPWEWRPHQLGRPPPPESPGIGGEFKRSRSKSDVAHLASCAGVGRTSPDSDVRPQDEYDQPWEWIQKTRQMSQVLTEKEKQSVVSRSGASTPDNARKHSPKRPSGEMKLELKHKHEVQGEKIDPILSLDEQAFYHGKLSRTEAEKLLKPCRECSYLVRQSESAQKDYSLSLKSAKGFMHMKIVSHSQGYILGEFSKPFLGIPQMIHYYTTHKLNIRGAEHMALLHPVDNQML